MRVNSPLWIFALLLTVLAVSCVQTGQTDEEFVDKLENLELQDSKWVSTSTNLILGAEKQLVDQPVLSGKHAIRLDPSAPFGLNFKIKSVELDEYIKVEVFFCGKGELVLVASHQDANFFYSKKSDITEELNNWKKLTLELSIPPQMDGEDLNIYVWNPGGGTVYADDFSLSYKAQKTYPVFDPMETMHVFIDTLDMIKLEKKRLLAFENGILETDEDDYVDGILFYKDTIIPVDLRLKGDWLDHLEGRKWSFRIKVKQGFTWNKIRTFSVHTPVARDFINEWMAHEMFRDADLLAPRYGFVPLTLNGKSLGVYAWEEHFEKQMVESLNRREGPILKFTEDHFWTIQKVFLNEGVYWHLPILQAAQINAFKESRTLSDTTLFEEFQIAQNLMYQYKNGMRPASEIFDIEKLAGYQAMMDLSRGFHGLTWHNQRCYYNPVISRIEPIFFDAYTELGVFEPERSAISGLIVLDLSVMKKFENLFWVRIFQDKEFLRHYISWLEKVSDSDWLDNFLSDKLPDLKYYSKMIRQEFPDYTYDSDFLQSNAENIRRELPKFIKYVDENPDFAHFNDDQIQLEAYSSEYHPAFPGQYVNAYQQGGDSVGDQHILIRNYWPGEVWVVGAGSSGSSAPGEIIAPVKLNAFEKFFPDTCLVKVSEGNDKIFLVADGQDEKFSVMVNHFPAPGNFSPEQSLRSDYSMKLPDEVIVRGNIITFPAAKIICNTPIVIPEGYKVQFKAGASIDMVNGAMFLSWSPIEMAGTGNDPIEVISSDKTSAGFTLLQTNDTCRISNVTFSGLNTLDLQGWKLTGAVNFYESPVIIDSCRFEDNVCEDALNIIRTTFTVKNSRFTGTFADAFDSDFCTGLVEEVLFTDIGNDAIDFSGSDVDIIDCHIERVGDKGVSCGEKSILRVVNTSVVSANIAYASKDLSALHLDNCSAENVVYGLVVFQKKPEFGPASILARHFAAEMVESLYLVEQFSLLHLNNSIIKGTENDLAKRFY
ncbi:MAG: hypothetical protein HN352_00080 [Bacteroidetes bacterium]|jgi:hypothetical protein|nr:hypothetical protein [Bacteroidota bacterium]MBT4400186.1 hypothetical protein [Bacteroidota bacterium]MBT4410086.1 hypothetical protein [Bacteroidota bacterium]MBT7092892.1 hypothetical protein [Bacteroidota bacterium]MBT7463310.1 hypothetical protein [Bacteroidota bacterium]